MESMIIHASGSTQFQHELWIATPKDIRINVKKIADSDLGQCKDFSSTSIDFMMPRAFNDEIVDFKQQQCFFLSQTKHIKELRIDIIDANSWA